MNNKVHQEYNQNSWQLASIQTASLGFPGIVVSIPLTAKYGPGAVTLSVLIGNLVLWFVAFGIVSMAEKERRNAIENAEDYIGEFGAKLASLISMAIFPIWYVLQIHVTSIPINNALFGEQNQHELITTIYGTVLGVLIAFTATRRVIHTIKKLTTAFLPILICYYLYAAFTSEISISFSREWGFSWECTITYISFLFAGMVNLPTFFRHARSKYDSYLALTLMTVIVVFFQIASIWISPSILTGNLFNISTTNPFILIFIKIVTIAFAIMLLFCSNLVNIYFSYPSWELVIPKIKKYPKFLFIGLGGAVIYALTRISPKFYNYINEFESVADNFIANLGTALILIFFVRIIVSHRPKPFEKLISTTAWVFGCIATAIATYQYWETPPIWVGIQTTVFFFAISIFIEEPFWSLKKLKHWLDKKPR